MQSYQEVFNVSKRTATNDLQSLTQKELIEKIGTTGKGTSYILRGSKGQNGQQRRNKGAPGFSDLPQNTIFYSNSIFQTA